MKETPSKKMMQRMRKDGYINADLISAKDLLPKKHGYFLLFHQEGTQLQGIIGFFVPPETFFRLTDGNVDDENITLQFEDISEWVDFWGLLPDWMFESENVYHDYLKEHGGAI